MTCTDWQIPECEWLSSPDIWLESLQHPCSAGEPLMKNESLGSWSFLEIFPHAGSVISRSISQLQRPLWPDPAVPHRAGRGRHHLLRDPAVLQGKDRNQGRERLGRVPPGTGEQFSAGSPSRSGFQSFSHAASSSWSFCLLPVNWSNASTPSTLIPHYTVSSPLGLPHLPAVLTPILPILFSLSIAQGQRGVWNGRNP